LYVLRLPLKGATRIREVRGIPAGPVNGGAEMRSTNTGCNLRASWRRTSPPASA